MSGITDPAEEYFKNGLWAWVTDQWKKLIGDDAGHLQVDVVESGLPSGAATSANQATMITALQLIDDLRAALNSVATDELDVIIDGQTADVEITQTAAADLTPGIMGWDGSAWHKLPMVWGFSSHYAERIFEANASAGLNVEVGGTVPSGEIWIVNAAVAWNTCSAMTRLWIQASDGSTIVTLAVIDSPACYEIATFSGASPIPATWYIRGVFEGCTAEDDLYLDITGYKMKVAE